MTNTKNHALLPDQKVLAVTIGLQESISGVHTPQEAARLLEVILTPQEIRTIAIRLRIMKMLRAGHNYVSIQQELCVSPGTIARVQLNLEHAQDAPKRGSKARAEKAAYQNKQGPDHSKKPAYSTRSKYEEWQWPAEAVTSIVRAISETRKRR